MPTITYNGRALRYLISIYCVPIPLSRLNLSLAGPHLSYGMSRVKGMLRNLLN